MELEFILLTPDLARAIEPWFDDPDTARSLGGRDWVRQALHLMKVMPGFSMDGTTVLARECYVVEEDGQLVALLDVEIYDDLDASLAIVVAPEARRRGVGRRVLEAMWKLPELKEVKSVFGSIDADNEASRRLFKAAGFKIASKPDHDNMLRVEKVRPGVTSPEARS